jgi:hypothetical protein
MSGLCISPQSGGPAALRQALAKWPPNPRAYLFGARAASAVRTLFVPALGDAASCPPCLGCPGVSSRSPLHARGALQGRPRGRALASTGEHAAGCGRRVRCAPSRSPSRACMMALRRGRSVTLAPCARALTLCPRTPLCSCPGSDVASRTADAVAATRSSRTCCSSALVASGRPS